MKSEEKLMLRSEETLILRVETGEVMREIMKSVKLAGFLVFVDGQNVFFEADDAEGAEIAGSTFGVAAEPVYKFDGGIDQHNPDQLNLFDSVAKVG